jgi:hypothetical protein
MIAPLILTLSWFQVEADDFSSGTSSRSTKLIHGGVRYLQKAIMSFDYEQVLVFFHPTTSCLDSSICLSLEEVAMPSGHKVLTEVDNNILLIVSDPQGTLDQHIKLHSIHVSNIIIILKYILLEY